MNAMNNSTNLKLDHREYNFGIGNFLLLQVKKKINKRISEVKKNN